MTPSRAGVLGHTAAVLVLAARVAFAGPSGPPPSGVVLRGGVGEPVQLASVVQRHRLTVVVFFSATCPCFTAHRARLAELARDMKARGVHVLVVDSERHAPGEPALAAVPGTDLPVLRDDDARLARWLDARYATEAFVFDSSGALRYRGGIDGDRKYLSHTPKPYLRDALLSLLEDRAPAFTTAKVLGCALRLR